MTDQKTFPLQTANDSAKLPFKGIAPIYTRSNGEGASLKQQI